MSSKTYRLMIRAVLITMMGSFLSSCANNMNNATAVKSSGYFSDMEVARIADKTHHENIAVRNYERAAKDDPASDEPKKALVRIYQQQGSTQQVLFWLQQILKNNPKSEFAYYHLGQLMQQQSSYNSALQYYLQLKNSKRYQSAALNNIAVILQLHEKSALAKQCFYAGITQYPDDAKLRYNAALSLISSRQPNDALNSSMRKALINTGDLQIQQMIKNANKTPVIVKTNSGNNVHFHPDLLSQVQSWCAVN